MCICRVKHTFKCLAEQDIQSIPVFFGKKQKYFTNGERKVICLRSRNELPAGLERTKFSDELLDRGSTTSQLFTYLDIIYIYLDTGVRNS